jgi:hypothetical protein
MQVSFIELAREVKYDNKQGKYVPGDSFASPVWVDESKRYQISSFGTILRVFKEEKYAVGSLGAIIIGSHGYVGRAVVGGQNLLKLDIAKEIASYLKPAGVLALAACLTGGNPTACSEFAKEIGRAVIAPTRCIDNTYGFHHGDGTWIEYYPK